VSIRAHPWLGVPPFRTSSKISKLNRNLKLRWDDGANKLMEYDQNNTLKTRYTQGPGLDEPLAMQRGSTNLYFEADGLGSITSLTSSAGAVTDYMVYDTVFFGGNTKTGPDAVPERFTGRELDETGLYYYRARYHDWTVGRFLSEDPLRFLISLDFYEYVQNNPVNETDPFGSLPRPVKPYQWRYCTGGEVSQCKQLCAAQGKKYESCRVSQRFRIGPQGLSTGPTWVDGPLSCSCEKTECTKASVSDPNAARAFGLFLGAVGLAGVAGAAAAAPEIVLPALPRLVPALAPTLLP